MKTVPHLEKVVVFLGGERYEHTDSAAEGSVDQTVAASGYQVGLLKGENRFADVKDAEGLGLLSGPGEKPSVPKALGPGGVLVDLVVDVLAKPDHGDVAEFVSHRYRLVNHIRSGQVCTSFSSNLTTLQSA